MQYAYRVYKNGSITSPVYGGTVSSLDVNSAVNKVISSCKIDVIHELDRTGMHSHFMLKGQEVGILIYANPEEY